MQINKNYLKEIIKHGLDEDLGEDGDITSNCIISSKQNIKFQINNRQTIILCGIDIVTEIFKATSIRLKTLPIKLKNNFKDGDFLPQNSVIMEGSGNARAIFAAERLALNLMQHLSGIATTTNQYVQKLSNSNTAILDTRKTIPTLRQLQKYAVKTGGGQNHRVALYDGILIKDNHIAAAGNINKAITLAKQKNPTKKIEIECDNLLQVKESILAKADIIMLDNMNLEQIKKAVVIINKKAKIEVSGGIKLNQIAKISQTGIDYISIGTLTHSVKAVDIGLDIC